MTRGHSAAQAALKKRQQQHAVTLPAGGAWGSSPAQDWVNMRHGLVIYILRSIKSGVRGRAATRIVERKYGGADPAALLARFPTAAEYVAYEAKVQAANGGHGFLGGFTSSVADLGMQLVSTGVNTAKAAAENPFINPAGVGIEKATGLSAQKQLEIGAAIGTAAVVGGELATSPAAVGAGAEATPGASTITVAGLNTGLTTGSTVVDSAITVKAGQMVAKKLAKKPAPAPVQTAPIQVHAHQVTKKEAAGIGIGTLLLALLLL